jgi:hypothetical protein
MERNYFYWSSGSIKRLHSSRRRFACLKVTAPIKYGGLKKLALQSAYLLYKFRLKQKSCCHGKKFYRAAGFLTRCSFSPFCNP